jgi:hypothetical protein
MAPLRLIPWCVPSRNNAGHLRVSDYETRQIWHRESLLWRFLTQKPLDQTWIFGIAT